MVVLHHHAAMQKYRTRQVEVCQNVLGIQLTPDVTKRREGEREGREHKGSTRNPNIGATCL